MDYKSVVVTWGDVSKTMNDDSFDDDADITNLLSNMQTIGWLYKSTKDTIMLVQEFCGDKPRDWVVIPKVLIKSTQEVD
jgi:hypothetical protein